MRSSRSSLASSSSSVVLVGSLLLACAACNAAASPEGGASPTGSVRSKPDGTAFLVDANRRGLATELRLTRLAWGRLVEVQGLDREGGRVPMQDEFLVAGALRSVPGELLLERNAVSGREALVILQDVTDTAPGGGRTRFFELLREAERNLTPVFDQLGGGAGLLSMVPRNATLVLQLDDLLDARTVSSETVRVAVGEPALTPFQARILADPNHGDLIDHDGDGTAEFHTTRILIDPTISELESFRTDPPLEVNGIGFPGSSSVALSNLRLALPSVPSNLLGQELVLQNLSGHRLSSADNGSVDFGLPTLPVVRAMRSGGASEVTFDPFNGFLPDDDAPRLIGGQPVRLESVPRQDASDGSVFVLDQLRFDAPACAWTPRVGDILRQPGIVAEVLEPPAPQDNGTVRDLRVRLVLFPASFEQASDWVAAALGPADLLTAFDPQADAGREGCFVRITPTPAGFPALPTEGLTPGSLISARFSEPMDPASVSAFDSFTLTRFATPLRGSDWVVGAVRHTRDLREFSFEPSLPLAHRVGTSEAYYLSVVGAGVTDLAGNALGQDLPTIRLRLDPLQPTQANGGRVARFARPDEDEPFGDAATGPLPEWTGQLFYSSERELIRPRAVTRYTALADRSQAVLGLMTPFTPGLATPLSPFGSRLQTVWRYIDVGFSLTDIANVNVDVEGLSWSPANDVPFADHFGSFEMRLSHARHAPDEFLDPTSLLPAYPNSGLKPTYANNVLDVGVEPQVVVHPRQRGYSIEPGDAFTAPSGTRLVPFPMNRDASLDPIYFSWRNSALDTRGGNQSNGVDPDQLSAVLGGGVTKVYSSAEVQTIGLPLLMDFRCFSEPGADGRNALDVSLARINSIRPFFRAFTTGGFGPNGLPVRIDPDLETRANGGFNPALGGASTPGQDPVVYMGAMDLVVRVSRVVSVWFEASDPAGSGGFAAPSYSPPVFEPAAAQRPTGTDIVFAFRGALSVGGEGAPAASDAGTLDLYGNHYADGLHDAALANTQIAFHRADSTWHEARSQGSDPLGIDGAAYYQVRATFVASARSGLVPELSALALAWQD